MRFWRPRLVLALACGVAACSDRTPTAPGAPGLELTDPGIRIDAGAVNGHVYGSFRVGAGSGSATVITSGPANFPGHPPAGPGSCVNGLWYNPQGKPTSGSQSRPHPHCIQPAAAIELVLEPISVCLTSFTPVKCGVKAAKGGVAAGLLFTNALAGDQEADLIGFASSDPTVQSDRTDPTGVLTAYAIDAATLGTTNHRVGTLTIDLAQYASTEVNYLDLDTSDGCAMDATIVAPCLNRVIRAVYNPLPAPDGLGPTDLAVEGFLWISPASAPYNY
jgi:hypothetical protein